MDAKLAKGYAKQAARFCYSPLPYTQDMRNATKDGMARIDQARGTGRAQWRMTKAYIEKSIENISRMGGSKREAERKYTNSHGERHFTCADYMLGGIKMRQDGREYHDDCFMLECLELLSRPDMLEIGTWSAPGHIAVHAIARILERNGITPDRIFDEIRKTISITSIASSRAQRKKPGKGSIILPASGGAFIGNLLGGEAPLYYTSLERGRERRRIRSDNGIVHRTQYRIVTYYPDAWLSADQKSLIGQMEKCLAGMHLSFRDRYAMFSAGPEIILGKDSTDYRDLDALFDKAIHLAPPRPTGKHFPDGLDKMRPAIAGD